MTDDNQTIPRRRMLELLGTSSIGSLAGCEQLTDPSTTATTTTGTPTQTESPTETRTETTGSASFALDNLTFPETAQVGRKERIRVTVANTGGRTGDTTVVLDIAGQTHQTNIELEAGATDVVTFEFNIQPGDYELSVRETTSAATLERGIRIQPYYPDNVPNPLIAAQSIRFALLGDHGWEDADPSTVLEELLRLDPDVVFEWGGQGSDGPPAKIGWWPEHKLIREFAHRHFLPFELLTYWRFHPQPWHENWYQQLPESEKWRHPDGSIVTHPRELVMELFDGTKLRYESAIEGVPDSIVPSLFAAGTAERLIIVGRDTFGFGANQFGIDLLITPLTGGLDFSEWAQAAFRTHLQNLSTERLDALNIDNPGEFNVRQAITKRNIGPEDVGNPAPYPLFREYNQFQHKYLKQFADTVFAESRADIPPTLKDAGTSVHSEGHWLQWQALNPANIYLSDHLDIIHLNLNHSTVPPDRPHDLSIKLGRAVGRFQKPVNVGGRLNSVHGSVFGLDPTQYYPTLMRLQIAQAYCHGGRRPIQVTTWGAVPYDETIQKAMRPNGTIAEELHELTNFIQAHRRFLSNFSEANDTVVMVSLPTALYRAPNWGYYRSGHEMPLGEAATVLRQEHVPYDVQIFDYPPLWEAPNQTEAIQEYDRIILPGIECVADHHVASIEAALHKGATVIATAGAPARDEHFQPREDLRELLADSENGHIINAVPEPGPDQTVQLSAGATTFASILQNTATRVELDTTADISLNVFTQADPERLIVHLLNFEYDPETDSVPLRENVELTIRDVGFEPGVARYYSVDGPTELSVSETAAEATVTIPQLGVWGFVVFGQQATDLEPDISKSAAAAKINQAKETIDEANLDQEDRIWVATKLENAEQAFAFESYAVTVELAKEAITIWNRLTTESAHE